SIIVSEQNFLDQRQRLESAHATEQMNDLRRALSNAERRIAELESIKPPAGAEAERGNSLDAFFAAFETSFRGGGEEIKNRQSVYLDRVAAASQEFPVLDIGCGRGEWIELLNGRNIAAYGIELNNVHVSEARKRNLDVREAEGLAHLRSLDDGSLSGVTGFQVIEHLDWHDLISMVDEIKRVLTPGGFLLFETPNPENLLVGASTFWGDPSHRAPLRPSVMRFTVEQRGFSGAEVIYLHPDNEEMLLPGADEISVRLNQLLYGARDYAIWARKA
ncbi:MAG: class I SAM-dependent methyltransferase, partial [Alphaproteobacteria bacterium]